MRRRELSSTGGLSLLGGLMAMALIAQTGCAPAKAPTPVVSAPVEQPPARVEKPAKNSLPGLIVTEIEGKRKPERLYSFSLRDADIREVLMAISKQTSFNIVLDPKVEGVVTVDLKNVTLTEALDTLTDLLELTYRIKRNIVRVFEPVPETRIFALQYVNLVRTGSSSASAQIGAGGGGFGTRGVRGGITTGSRVDGGDSGQTTVNTSTDTDLWSDIESNIGDILSPNGKVVVNKQSGNILVTDFPKVLDRIASFLERIEGSVQRQVIIEARIVEVSLNGKYKFGIDWSAIAKAGALQGSVAGRIFSQSLAPTDAKDFQIGVTSTDFETVLKVLSTQGEVNVLSSPKLTTLNNQTSILKAATEDVFFLTETTRIPTAGGGFESITTVSPRTVTIGVVLSVTPQISSDGYVILHIRPTVSRSTGERSITIADGEDATTITVPILDIREADLIARARSGQVVVIGGLMQEEKIDIERKVPFLGDLPVIGRLFRETEQESKKSELVVLLSSTVMVGKKVDEVSARELERMEKMKGGSPW